MKDPERRARVNARENARQRKVYVPGGPQRWWMIKMLYGLTQPQFEAKVAAQGGLCAICQEPQTKWFVDHDHSCCPGRKSCGKCVRALLCHGCNNGLGGFKDDKVRLQRAVSYLEEYEWRKVTEATEPPADPPPSAFPAS